jgi:hypothetical protein
MRVNRSQLQTDFSSLARTGAKTIARATRVSRKERPGSLNDSRWYFHPRSRSNKRVNLTRMVKFCRVAYKGDPSQTRRRDRLPNSFDECKCRVAQLHMTNSVALSYAVKTPSCRYLRRIVNICRGNASRSEKPLEHIDKSIKKFAKFEVNGISHFPLFIFLIRKTKKNYYY